MGKAKKIAVGVILLIILVVGLEVGLVLSGAGDFRVGEPTVSGDKISMPLTLPNRGFVDLQGSVTISLLGSNGRVLSESVNDISIPAGETRHFSLQVDVPSDVEPFSVAVDSSVNVLGIPISLPRVESSVGG